MTALKPIMLAAAATLAITPALAQPYYGGGYGYEPPPPPSYYGGPYGYYRPAPPAFYGGAPYGYYRPPPRPFSNDANNTGGSVNIVVPRRGLGADTYQSNSAVAGNQNRPELAVPNGSGGGGSR